MVCRVPPVLLWFCRVTLRVRSLSSSPPSSLMVTVPLHIHLDLRKLVDNMGTRVDAKPLCACIDCPPVPFYCPHSLMTGFTPWRLMAVNSSTKMVRTSSRAESRITKRTSVLAVIEHPQCHSTWYMARNPSGFDTMYRRPLNAVSTCGSLVDIG